MKVLNFFIGWMIVCQPVYAQLVKAQHSKPVMDTSVINNWVRFDAGKTPLISPDGNYIAYWTTTNHYQRSKKVNKLIVQATAGKWQREYVISRSSDATFTDDNYFLLQVADSLLIIKPGEDQHKVIPAVISFQYQKATSTSWLAWRTKDEKLIVHNFGTGEEFQLQHVQQFVFNTDGTALVVHCTEKINANKEEAVIWKDLTTFNSKTIWQASTAKPVSWAFDSSGQQLVFQVIAENSSEREIQYYQKEWSKAALKVNDKSAGIDSNLVIAGFPAPCFNKDGTVVLFSLTKKPERRKPLPEAASVDVWSYTDKTFQTAQALAYPETYSAAVGINQDHVIQLQYEDEKVIQTPFSRAVNKYLIVRRDTIGDRFWQFKNASFFKNYLVSVDDGKRIPLPDGVEYAVEFWLSPNGDFVLYYLQSKKNYYSYNIRTGKTVLISGNVPVGLLSLLDETERPVHSVGISVGIAGWLQDSESVLVYDNYDIWMLDLQGNRPALNLTNGAGQRTHTKFRLLRYYESIIPATEKIYVVGYQTISKQNGFFSMQLNQRGNPAECTAGPYMYDLNGTNILPKNPLSNIGVSPQKASQTDKWLVCRQSATEAPNYFLTTDFKQFKQITDYHPNAGVNWLTASLVSFPQLDGTRSHGILYKPENFDSTKRYPLIITYYRQYSHRLYNFLPANYAQNDINIPWFVSRGYVVFTPDIYFKAGTASGPHALNAIDGAAQYLSTFKYIDRKRIGIMGHSVAGALTHYIVTHSTRFAAALAGAGVSNSIASALQLDPQLGISRLSMSESYSLGGKNMWDRPDLYLSMMSVLRANKVTTPLLMLHCLHDGAVPWQQSLDMFTALWRLEKPVWLLQYDNGTHGVGEVDQLDYTFRVTQFFDHYLKGSPAPLWMQKGIKYSDKKLTQGY